MPVDADPEVPGAEDAAGEETAGDGAVPEEIDAPALPVNELFHSLQGEGRLAGVPSTFVRTSGCNLRCWFCDSYHTSWEPTGAWRTVDDIVAAVADRPGDHVVLTGGEPTIHAAAVDLLDRLADRGYHTTVETNGTVFRDAAIDLASLSPKLASSTPTQERPPAGGAMAGNGTVGGDDPATDGPADDLDVAGWSERHEERRLDYETMARYVEAYETQLKFVVTGPDDIPEIERLIERLRETTSACVRDADVLLMPEGTTRAELESTRRVVADLALEHGYRYTPRIHVDIWNDAPGT
jgi:7-carboxy-7-deazaguanine synthase